MFRRRRQDRSFKPYSRCRFRSTPVDDDCAGEALPARDFDRPIESLELHGKNAVFASPSNERQSRQVEGISPPPPSRSNRHREATNKPMTVSPRRREEHRPHGRRRSHLAKIRMSLSEDTRLDQMRDTNLIHNTGNTR